MSFPATSGILTPKDFNAVTDVYSDITGETWFTRSQLRREQFALEVLDAYRQGMLDRDILRSHCRELALVYYGDGGIDR